MGGPIVKPQQPQMGLCTVSEAKPQQPQPHVDKFTIRVLPGAWRAA
jgi:hypothetical protein